METLAGFWSWLIAGLASDDARDVVQALAAIGGATMFVLAVFRGLASLFFP